VQYSTVDWNQLRSKESQMAKGIVPRWFLAVLSLIPLTAKADEVKLAGTWSFQLDRENRGEADQWFTR
jgi:hypothetical protein